MNEQNNNNLVPVNQDDKTKDIAKKTADLGKRFLASPPPSLEWMYSLGFKVGLFVMLKSVLVLYFCANTLDTGGYAIVLGQIILALILVAAGLVLQNVAIYNEPVKLRRGTFLYLLGAVICGGVELVTKNKGLTYFKKIEVVSAKTFLSSLGTSTKEIGLKILFADNFIWVALALILFTISITFLIVNYGFKETFKFEKPTKQDLRTLLIVVCIIVVVIAAFFLAPRIAHIGSVRIEMAPDDFKAQTATSAAVMLQDLGFENIEIKAVTAFAKPNNDLIKSVSFNGDENFVKGDWIPKNALVEIESFANRHGIKSEYVIMTNQTFDLKAQITDGTVVTDFDTAASDVILIEDGVIHPMSDGEATVTFVMNDIHYTCEITVLKTVDEFLKDLTNKADEALKDAGSKAGEVLQEIKDQAGEAKDKTEEAIKDAAEKAIDKIKELFGNGSN